MRLFTVIILFITLDKMRRLLRKMFFPVEVEFLKPRYYKQDAMVSLHIQAEAGQQGRRPGQGRWTPGETEEAGR